jgi:hypothetical protein
MFLYQLVGQVLGAALQPLSTEIQQCLYAKFPDVALSPADLADMVERAIISEGDAIAQAALSGIDERRFKMLVAAAGEAPGVEQLVEALRRGVIPEHGQGPDSTSFDQGIRESHLKTKWLGVVKALADIPLPPAVAVDAVVEGQIDHDLAAHEAFLNGINGDRFQIMVNTRGNPPDPTQLAEMVHRGVIPLKGSGPQVLSFEQGISEGATKDKWIPGLEGLMTVLPPARTVTALARNGSISDDQALQWFMQTGLSQEAAAAYLADAHHQKTVASKQLAASTVTALYRDRLMSKADATANLVALKYSAEDAAFELALADFQAVDQAVRQAIAKIHSQFVAHKISDQDALTALNGVQIPPAHVAEVMTQWKLERQANVKVLSAGEIADAVYYSIIDLQTGVDELVNQGYSEQDATIRIMIRLHGKPPPTPATPPGG